MFRQTLAYHIFREPPYILSGDREHEADEANEKMIYDESFHSHKLCS